MHACSLWETSWAGSCGSVSGWSGSLGLSRLRLGVQSQPDHLESPGSKGQSSWGRMPRARGFDPRREAEPICGDMAGPHHSTLSDPGVFLEPGSSHCPRAGGVLLPVPEPSRSHLGSCREQTHGAGVVLFCFHHTGECATEYFLYLKGNQLAISTFA